MRSGLLLAAAALTLVPAPAFAGRATVKRAARALVRSVEPRRGIAFRSLVVVPLVARDAVEGGPPYALATPGLAWSARSDDEVEIDARGVADDRYLPTGMRLQAPAGRRLLAGPVLAPAGGRPRGDTVRYGPGGETPAFLGVTGPEVRQVLRLAPHADAMAGLLELERRLAGLPETEPATFAAIADAPRLAEVRAAARTALRPLPQAYGGEVRGHLILVGNRPLEIVLAADATTYADYARASAGPLATYLALWEELYGRAGFPPEANPDWPRALEVAAARLRALEDATWKRTPDPCRWRMRARGGAYVGWALVDAAEDAAWIEAWPGGDASPFPAPAREPGGRPQDEGTGGTGGGGLTLPFLERYLERLREIRRRG